MKDYINEEYHEGRSILPNSYLTITGLLGNDMMRLKLWDHTAVS
jgi:hypothetical protein